MLLKGAVAILTGAGRKNSVGAATAKLLAQQGCNVLINCLKSRQQAELVVADCQQEGVDAELFVGDVSQAEVCQEMSNFVRSKWGRADVLVNCVGATKAAPYEKLEQLTAEDFNRVLSINITAPYLMAQAFQELLRVSGDAVIVNVSSTAGITGKASSIVYAAAKGGENTLTLALAQALSPEVRVNAVCPGFIDSSWWEDAFVGKEDSYKTLLNNMREGNLLRKILKPMDVATTILGVIQNPMMTGELIRLDIGAHIGKGNPRNH
jgi:3-oxoacyl-[acyl-carrier protein] reductase